MVNTVWTLGAIGTILIYVHHTSLSIVGTLSEGLGFKAPHSKASDGQNESLKGGWGQAVQ